ncbi:MAG TPA: hypothetical protein VK837_00005, partial [Longimicrobiales bacterium]|nr:hypothetical protein [Longimicrobiales bacterium]
RALPASLREEIGTLDLSRLVLTGLEADLILIHGRDDPLVPYTETVELANAAGAEQTRIYLLRGLQHVDIGALSASDLETLLRATYRVLSYRDATGGEPP